MHPHRSLTLEARRLVHYLAIIIYLFSFAEIVMKTENMQTNHCFKIYRELSDLEATNGIPTPISPSSQPANSEDSVDPVAV